MTITLRLVYLKELPLETSYTAVIGSVRRLNEAYAFAGGCLDKTGVGEGPYEEIKQFMRGMEGVTLTAQMKEDIMGKLKLALGTGQTHSSKRQPTAPSPVDGATMRTHSVRDVEFQSPCWGA